MTRVLTWKDEGRTGPARLYPCLEAYETAQRGVPYGSPLPGRDLGWVTRAAARRLAREHDATFREGP
jgi:hypothetical protein